MDDKFLDDKIRAYYRSRALSAASVARISAAAAEEPAPRRARLWPQWLGVAAAVGLVAILSFHFVKDGDPSSPFLYQVAGEMAMRHNSEMPFDVVASSYEEVESGLANLLFKVAPSAKGQMLSEYEVLGGRHCEVQGVPGAHIKLRHRTTGEVCSLYVASLDGALAELDQTDTEVNLVRNKVRMWADSGRLFALID